MKNSGCCENPGGETGRDNYIVILRLLVGHDQDRVGLTEVDVEGVISGLKSVRAFDLNQLHLMPLNSEVNGCRKADIRYSKPVCLACTESESSTSWNLILMD